MPHLHTIYLKKALMLAVCLFAVVAVTACGVKPKAIKPPSTATTAYPAPYPAAHTVK